MRRAEPDYPHQNPDEKRRDSSPGFGEENQRRHAHRETAGSQRAREPAPVAERDPEYSERDHAAGHEKCRGVVSVAKKTELVRVRREWEFPTGLPRINREASIDPADRDHRDRKGELHSRMHGMRQREQGAARHDGKDGEPEYGFTRGGRNGCRQRNSRRREIDPPRRNAEPILRKQRERSRQQQRGYRRPRFPIDADSWRKDQQGRSGHDEKCRKVSILRPAGEEHSRGRAQEKQQMRERRRAVRRPTGIGFRDLANFFEHGPPFTAP